MKGVVKGAQGFIHVGLSSDCQKGGTKGTFMLSGCLFQEGSLKWGLWPDFFWLKRVKNTSRKVTGEFSLWFLIARVIVAV